MKQAILTKKEAKKLLITQNPGQFVVLASLDLGLTTEKVKVINGKALLRGEEIEVKRLEKLKEDTCYVIENGALKSIDFFSEETNIFYKLVPTKDWPIITLSSVPMHRFKTISPKLSAELMVKEISPISGRVLDTCAGLGYTAILCAGKETVNEVITFEIDENVLRIAEHNPYSNELFSNPKIKLFRESVFDGIKKLPSNSFDRVLHDPPTLSFAPNLYSAEFYEELLRVMKPKAILYHYCPNPGKTKGRTYYLTILKKLKEAGFINTKYNEKSSGIRAEKK
jgi:predicted methyltransferase